MSWRLPSGKALAEFALQAGFLAPLIMSGPRVKKRVPPPGVVPAALAKTPLQQEEVPGPAGTFPSPSAGDGADGFKG